VATLLGPPSEIVSEARFNIQKLWDAAGNLPVAIPGRKASICAIGRPAATDFCGLCAEIAGKSNSSMIHAAELLERTNAMRAPNDGRSASEQQRNEAQAGKALTESAAKD